MSLGFVCLNFVNFISATGQIPSPEQKSISKISNQNWFPHNHSIFFRFWALFLVSHYGSHSFLITFLNTPHTYINILLKLEGTEGGPLLFWRKIVMDSFISVFPLSSTGERVMGLSLSFLHVSTFFVTRCYLEVNSPSHFFHISQSDTLRISFQFQPDFEPFSEGGNRKWVNKCVLNMLEPPNHFLYIVPGGIENVRWSTVLPVAVRWAWRKVCHEQSFQEFSGFNFIFLLSTIFASLFPFINTFSHNFSQHNHSIFLSFLCRYSLKSPLPY